LFQGDSEGWEAESPCFQESKADEEGQRISIVDSEVDHKATDKKWRGAINDLREHNQTTPQSLDVQIIEDRIDKVLLCNPQCTSLVMEIIIDNFIKLDAYLECQ